MSISVTAVLVSDPELLRHAKWDGMDFRSLRTAECTVGQPGPAVVSDRRPAGGPADQDSKIRTFDIAPCWTHLINTNALFSLAGGRGEINTTIIRARIPLPMLRPDLQVETDSQSRRLTDSLCSLKSLLP